MKKRIYIILCLFLFIAIQVNAQKVKSSKSRNKIDYKQLDYAKTIFNDSSAQAIAMVQDYLLTSIKNNDNDRSAKSYQTLAEMHQSIDNFPSAIDNFKRALQYLSYESEKVKVYEQIAQCYETVDINSSKNYYTKALNHYKKTKNKKSEAKVLVKLGDISVKNNELNKANEYYNSALKLAQKHNIKTVEIDANLGLANVASLNDKSEDAWGYNQYAIQQSQSINDVSRVEKSYSNQNTNLKNQKKKKKNNENVNLQIQNNLDAYNFNISNNNINEALQSSAELADNFKSIDSTEKALEVLEESAPLLENTDDLEVKKIFLNTLSEVYDEVGDKQKANEIKQQYEDLVSNLNAIKKNQLAKKIRQDSLLKKTETTIMMLEKERELNNKTIELLREKEELKNKSIQQQKWLTITLGSLLLITLIFLILGFRINQKRKKANLLLELQSLRSQMNPHFIFNSLNSVNEYIAKQDELAANRYISQFSKLMRQVLENSQQDFISLQKELDLLEIYLSLEHNRFKDKFDYFIETDEKIDLENIKIPPMLVQPFIENAIWHGLRYKEEKGKLWLKILSHQNKITIVVEDDGIGRTKSRQIKTTNQLKTKSTAIKNAKSRIDTIEQLYKRKIEINISDRDTKTSEGTIVNINLHP